VLLATAADPHGWWHLREIRGKAIQRVSFVPVTRDANNDVYLLDPSEGEGAKLVQMVKERSTDPVLRSAAARRRGGAGLEHTAAFMGGRDDVSAIRARRAAGAPGGADPATAHQPGAALRHLGAAGPVVPGRRRLGRIGMVGHAGRRGIVLVSVDNRGPAGRGEAFKGQVYRRLGRLESDDQIAVARELGKLAWVDPQRIRMVGGSYGGYLTALTLARAGKLALPGGRLEVLR
jgi:hypothetical protein